MSNDAELDALADVIAERVRQRLAAARVGREEPCTPSKPCPPQGCDTCEDEKTCGPRQMVVGIGASRVGLNPSEIRTSANMAPFIDHTLLKPDATREELVKLCDEAAKYGFATVCVNSANVGFCAQRLRGTGVSAIAVVGFPLGAGMQSAKAFEAREAVRQGAAEIDMVINIGALKSKEYKLVCDDIAAVVAASKPAPVKVILETSMLDTEQKIIACALSKAAGAAFVKTSTGFGGGGATVEDIALMRRIVGDDMGVKASGGVRSTEDAQKLLAAGADRLGASASVAIVTGKSAGAGKY